MLADHAHQPLRQHRHQRRRDQVILHAHVGQPRNRAGRVVGVQRREYEVAGERRADRDVGRLAVANLAHHDDVRILTHNVPQPGSKRQPDLRVHVELVDPVHLVFDRIFNRDDLLVALIDPLQRRIQRGGFAAAGGPRHQKDAVRQRRVIVPCD